LTSERLERLGPVLRLILCEGDVHCGTPCAEASNRVRLGKKSSRRRPSSLTQRVRNDESPRRQGLGSVVGGLWLPPHHF
jgi:hypothetical protein